MKRKGEFGEKVDTSDEIAPMMSEVTVAPGHDATKEMNVAAAVEEIDRVETTTQAMVVETKIVATARQNENAVAASDEMMMMISTLETAVKGGENEHDDCNERGGGKDDERDDIVAAAQEKVMAAFAEMTQEMEVAVAAAKLEDGRCC